MALPATLANRGEQTRSLILETAIQLFCQRGYDQTTMRMIAERAGVALGNAYYYFKSKDHLMQAFYARINEQQLLAARPILELEHGFKQRLIGIIRAELAILEPNHALWAELFKVAADPRSPLNPFSEESKPVRNSCIKQYGEMLAGTKEKVPKEFLPYLPKLLWLFHMGIILFWIHDNSPARVRTHRLIEHGSELVALLIKLVNLPGMRPIRNAIVRLLEGLRDAGPNSIFTSI